MPPTAPSPDGAAALIARIAGGDPEAFSRFYDTFARTVFGLIQRVLQDPGAAEEVLQGGVLADLAGGGPVRPAAREPRGVALHARQDAGNRQAAVHT
jgi:hypothetical protein